MSDVATLLARLGAIATQRLDRHRGTHRVAFCESALGANLELDGSTWSTSVRERASTDQSTETSREVSIRFRCVAGALPRATVSVCIDLPWSRDAYLCIPGAVYAGNRFAARRCVYPPMFNEADCRPDLPTIITDVPRLEFGEGDSRIDLLAADATAPAIGVVRPDGVAMWVSVEPLTRLGQVSLHVEESAARDRLRLRLCAPGLREDYDYEGGNTTRTSLDRPADFVAGDEVELVLRIQVWDQADVSGLLRRWPDLLLAHTELGDHPAQLPFSAAFAIQEEKYEGNWKGTHFSPGMGTSPYDGWQSGWVGGGMATLPLLVDGNVASQARAATNLDWLVGPGQAPSGWFYGIIHEGRSYGDGFGRSGTERWLLTRKSADVLYFLAKQILAKPDHPSVAAWRAGLQRCAEAMARTWRAHGELGQFIDHDSGVVLVPGSAAGAIAPAGLALAAGILERTDFLTLAEEMALADQQRWVARGLSTGGPGEILQGPDSESAFALLESAVVLAQVTGAAGWWQRAAEAACLAITWVFAWDFPFPKTSTFGALAMRARGSVWANVQNKHSAPGICTLSGDSLLRLARATGDLRWLDILRGIARALPQYLSRADRPIKDLPPGWMCERVNTSDWERSWCPPGEVFHGSCWCEVSLLLTRIEVPGVYVRRDLGRCWAFDHVDVTLDDQALTLTNPTNFPASVRVLVEDGEQAARVLPITAVAGLPQVTVPAGKSVRWPLSAGR